MSTPVEVARLKQVYQRYADDGLERSKWSPANPGNQAIRHERRYQLGRLLQAAGLLPLGSRRILDVGCGAGEALAEFASWGARPECLYGLDLLPARLRLARGRVPEAQLYEGNAEALPFADRWFDVISLFTVLTSVLDGRMARNISGEVQRTLRPGGAIIWYDFRLGNPLNPQVRGLPRRRIRELFPGFELRLRPITVLPPLARRLGRWTGRLYPRLAAWPCLCSHYVGLLRKQP